MKTPEEIKKGILCEGPCNDCPYEGRIMSDGGCRQAVSDDALAYIQQLEDHIREVTKLVPKWIGAKERLPDERNVIEGGKDGTCSELVLVFVQDDLGNSFTCDDIIANGEWVNYPAPLFEVTHWMPLPEPPKEET